LKEKEEWIQILKKIKIIKIESIPHPFNYLKFHTSAASGQKNGQSDQKRNCAILA
jgi:hypothetical protein